MTITPPKSVEDTRYYMTAFIESLRDLNHSAENVRAVLQEFAGMVIAEPSPSGSMSAAGASALPGEALSEAQILHEARACGAPPPVAPWHTKYVNGIPQFNPTAECSPTLTQCPRCNNPHHACDRGAPQQTEWLAEAERLADAYAQQSWINGCNGSAAGMTTGPESEARAALLSHLGKRSEPPGK